MRKLPQINGWTIDVRLNEIRRVTSEGIEFVPFESPKATPILEAWLACESVKTILEEK